MPAQKEKRNWWDIIKFSVSLVLTVLISIVIPTAKSLVGELIKFNVAIAEIRKEQATDHATLTELRLRQFDDDSRNNKQDRRLDQLFFRMSAILPKGFKLKEDDEDQ